MIKTYKLTLRYRNYSCILRGKSGNQLRYNFTGGDPLTGKAATITLKSQYAQDLLEQSEFFKKGYAKLVSMIDGGEKPVFFEDAKVTEKIEEVSSPEQLLEFVAEKLEKVYKQPEAALKYAQKMGFEFPNLTL